MDQTATGRPAWRPASADDLDAIMAIQAEVHPLLQERREVLADKLAFFPEGCKMLMERDSPLAYAIAHPYRLNETPALDRALATLPDDADCLYIHDVALRPAARGKGCGRAFVDAMTRLARARGWSALSLVSVYDTYPIWERCGFRIQPLPGLADKFGPFGHTARYMTATLI